MPLLNGLSPLHQAIVNEDVEMVYFLCKKGADVHQRCYGSFFCADDQKASRTDSLEHEWVDLVQNTRYTGQMYWGELPLSFAACTNNQEMFTLAYNSGASLSIETLISSERTCLAARLAINGYEEEADNLFTNISYLDDVIITVQQLAYFESGRNEPLQPQCHLWNYRGRKQM
ncbi:ankyrin repeat protein, partial [Ostertagia ostertagi]